MNNLIVKFIFPAIEGPIFIQEGGTMINRWVHRERNLKAFYGQRTAGRSIAGRRMAGRSMTGRSMAGRSMVGRSKVSLIL